MHFNLEMHECTLTTLFDNRCCLQKAWKTWLRANIYFLSPYLTYLCFTYKVFLDVWSCKQHGILLICGQRWDIFYTFITLQNSSCFTKFHTQHGTTQHNTTPTSTSTTSSSSSFSSSSSLVFVFSFFATWAPSLGVSVLLCRFLVYVFGLGRFKCGICFCLNVNV